MPVYTPGGLKIRYSPEFAFTLLARLYPRVTPFDVLLRAQGIDGIPSMLSFLSALAVLYSLLTQDARWWFYLLLFTVAGRLLGIGVVHLSFIMSGPVFWLHRFLTKLSILMACINGLCISLLFGLPLEGLNLLLIVTAFFSHGIRGVLIAEVTFFAAALLDTLLDHQYMKYQFKMIGEAHSRAELSFDAAYTYFAKRCYVDMDMYLGIDETKLSNWELCKAAYEVELNRDCTRIPGH